MKKTSWLLGNLQKDWRMLVLAGGLSFGFVAFVSWCDRPNEQAPQIGVDTLIPSGYLLIPIEVQNYDSLDSLLGQHGVVDLFKGSGKDSKIVARNVRMLRAPQNPSHFAVLVPESQAGAILSAPGSFYVAVKSPNQLGTQIVHQRDGAKRIHFDGD